MKLSTLSTMVITAAMIALPAFAADNAAAGAAADSSKPAVTAETKTETKTSTKTTKTHKHRHCSKKSGAKCSK